MAHDGDDDKPKRSWREIDAMRDKSAHRSEKPAGGIAPDRLSRSQAYRSYKTQLNKLFAGGDLPEALKSKIADKGVGDEAKRKRELTQALLGAGSAADVRAALAQYREAFGPPEDEEVLAKLLDLDDAAIALETLTTIDRLHGEARLKRAGSLKARIKTAQMTSDSGRVQEAAKALLAKL